MTRCVCVRESAPVRFPEEGPPQRRTNRSAEFLLQYCSVITIHRSSLLNQPATQESVFRISCLSRSSLFQLVRSPPSRNSPSPLGLQEPQWPAQREALAAIFREQWERPASAFDWLLSPRAIHYARYALRRASLSCDSPSLSFLLPMLRTHIAHLSCTIELTTILCFTTIMTTAVSRDFARHLPKIEVGKMHRSSLDPLVSLVCHLRCQDSLASTPVRGGLLLTSALALALTLARSQLHAHLTGSISRDCLHHIWLKKKEADPTLELPDPLDAIPPDGIASNHNIKT